MVKNEYDVSGHINIPFNKNIRDVFNGYDSVLMLDIHTGYGKALSRQYKYSYV